MKKGINIFLTIFYLFICLNSVQMVRAEDTTEWMPKWKVGDWWEIQMFYANWDYRDNTLNWTGPSKIRYDVIDEREIVVKKRHRTGQRITTEEKNIQCMVLEIKMIRENDNRRMKVFYSKENLLIYKAEYYEKEKLKYTEVYNEHNPEPLFVSTYLFPFSVPLFPVSIGDKKIPVKKKLEIISNVKLPEVMETSGIKIPKSEIDYEINYMDSNRIKELINNSIPGFLNKKEIFKDGKRKVEFDLGDRYKETILNNINSFICESNYIEINFKNNNDEMNYYQIWNKGIPWCIYGKFEYKLDLSQIRYYLINYKYKDQL